ncbi:MAG: TraR/DksA family transcriptional regulator [Deltaproteobacteria bacterium]|nr:TraR/DksA family transcriptional regulator [Deltaproteobacteria bacterium]
MDQAVLEALTEELLRHRATLVGEVADTEADLHFITEDRETDLEEHAQEERAASFLAQLDEREKHEIAAIDAALGRIAEGTYGSCEGCGEEIAAARLRALPATRFCVDCAGDQEQWRPLATEEVVQHPGPVPADLSLLSDWELAEVIHEQVRADGRVDMDELRLVCRHGVVHLEGALPSEAEHSILRQVITDELGLEEIVDHVRVAELLWEREERTKAVPSEERLQGVEPSGTEDIVESLEEGIDYVPPISPTPEEE